MFLELAFCSGFIIVGAQNALDAFESFGVGATRAGLIFSALPVLILFAWIRKLKDLWVLSFVGLIVYVGGVMGISYYDGGETLTHPTDGIVPPGLHLPDGGLKIMGIVGFIGVSVYSLEGINLVLPVEASLKHPNSGFPVMGWGMTLYSISCSAFGAFAYGAGLGSCPIITDCFAKGATATIIVQLALVASLIFTHALTLFPAAEILERKIFGDEKAEDEGALEDAEGSDESDGDGPSDAERGFQLALRSPATERKQRSKEQLQLGDQWEDSLRKSSGISLEDAAAARDGAAAAVLSDHEDESRPGEAGAASGGESESKAEGRADRVRLALSRSGSSGLEERVERHGTRGGHGQGQGQGEDSPSVQAGRHEQEQE